MQQFAHLAFFRDPQPGCGLLILLHQLCDQLVKHLLPWHAAQLQPGIVVGHPYLEHRVAEEVGLVRLLLHQVDFHQPVEHLADRPRRALQGAGHLGQRQGLPSHGQHAQDSLGHGLTPRPLEGGLQRITAQVVDAAGGAESLEHKGLLYRLRSQGLV
jgi:hypothetical protein